MLRRVGGRSKAGPGWGIRENSVSTSPELLTELQKAFWPFAASAASEQHLTLEPVLGYAPRRRSRYEMAGSGRCDQRQRRFGGCSPCSSGRLPGLDVSAAALLTGPPTTLIVGVSQSFANFFSKFAAWSRNSAWRNLPPQRDFYATHSFTVRPVRRSLPVRREISDTGQTPDHPPPIALSTAALP